MQMAPQGLENVYFGSGNGAPIQIAREWLKLASAPPEVRLACSLASCPEMAPQTIENAQFRSGNGSPIQIAREWLANG